MTVTAIRLQNFMAFGEVEDEDEGWIELKPISLLYGRNSSGKSAIIRALLLLKQSLYDAPADSLFAYRVDDKLDIGSFLEMAHTELSSDEADYIYDPNADDWMEKKTINFEFRCKVEPQELYYLVAEGDVVSRNEAGVSVVPERDAWVSLTLSYGWMPSEQGRGNAMLVGFQLKSPWSYIKGEDKNTIFEAIRLPKKLSFETGGWRFNSDFLYEHWLDEWQNYWVAIQVGLTSNFLPTLFFGETLRKLEQPNDFKLVNSLLKSARESIISFLENIEYIRPIRPDPKREYFLDDKQQKSWQNQGLGSYLELLRDDLSGHQRDQLNKWVNTLLQTGGDQINDVYSIKPKPLINHADRALLTQLLIEDKIVGSIAVLDVGFGISQVLPVLVQSILSKDVALVVVEQPELHLHPSAQAKLADLFIELAVQGKCFLIETHSEHLMLRFRRRIAETTLDSLQAEHEQFPHNRGFSLQTHHFGLDFVMRKEGVSKVEVINVNHRGQLIAPSEDFTNFFDDDLTEASLLARAKMAILGIEYGDEDSG